MADDENQPDLYDGAEPEARPVRPRVDGAPPEVGEDASLEALLAYLKRTRGFDFTGYKRASLSRRVRKRMDEVGVEDFATYEDFLEVHPGEFGALFNTVLINVTCFFRDPESWAYLRQEVIPRLIARKAPDAPIRAWSAGCASGEEAYSLAIALAEALGPEQFRARVKIYATDVDDDALRRARQASYGAGDITEVPAELATRYFDHVDGRYALRGDLRRAVIFGRHDLMQEAPISRMDVIACRNVLMYFNGETQARILSRLHFALNDTGVLFLGRAETLLTRTNLFAPADLKRRVFTKHARPEARDRRTSAAAGGLVDDAPASSAGLRLREAALDASPAAQVVFRADASLALANERARTLFGLTDDDVGRPLHDLELAYRPVDLRAAIDRAYVDRRPVVVDDVEWPGFDGTARTYCVRVEVIGAAAGPLGVAATFSDVSAATRLRRELERSHEELEAAYEELRSTNEELETTNEELQSTIEELETTNEEVQSANAELETMNEELQSTNVELQTINDEVRRRSDALNESGAFLDAVLSRLRGAVVMVDGDLRVVVWNRGAEEMWGVRGEEAVGSALLGLDIGFPLEQLDQPLRAALLGHPLPEPARVTATDRRGRQFECRVIVAPFRTDGSVRGAILLME